MDIHIQSPSLSADFSKRRVRGRQMRFGPIVRAVVFALSVTAVAMSACGSRITLTLALPVADWWTSAPFTISQSGSAFADRGVVVSTLEVTSGLASKNAVLAGTADVGLSAATPLALAAAKVEGLVILGTYLSSSSVVGLVKPRELPPGALPPAPVATVPSTISESYLYQYLSSIGQENLMVQNKLNQLNVRPPDVPGLIGNGSAKSAVIWEPYLSMAASQPGFVADRDAVQFEVNLYLLTRPSVLRDRPSDIRAFIATLDDSCRFLREHADQARQQVEQKFGYHSGFLLPTWSSVSYGVALNRDKMIQELTREAEVAKRLGRIESMPSFDYLFSR